jgi:predicted nucleic acid-binding Zn ribbon protein
MAKPMNKGPAPLGDALSPILERFDTQGQFGIVRVIKAWPEIVGETIARRSEIASLKFHTLVVKVSGAMWIQELNLMKTRILELIAKRLGDDIVRDIRFTHGKLSRRNPPRLRPVGRPARHSIKMPDVKDPELRAAFERLIELWGRSGR